VLCLVSFSWNVAQSFKKNGDFPKMLILTALITSSNAQLPSISFNSTLLGKYLNADACNSLCRSLVPEGANHMNWRVNATQNCYCNDEALKVVKCILSKLDADKQKCALPDQVSSPVVGKEFICFIQQLAQTVLPVESDPVKMKELETKLFLPCDKPEIAKTSAASSAMLSVAVLSTVLSALIL
jgi:hypothetical protein